MVSFANFWRIAGSGLRTRIHRSTAFSPQALRASAMAWTILDDAGHNIVRVWRARPISRTSGVRCATPIPATDLEIKANTVIAPIVRTTTTNGGQGWSHAGQERKGNKSEFHDSERLKGHNCLRCGRSSCVEYAGFSAYIDESSSFRWNSPWYIRIVSLVSRIVADLNTESFRWDTCTQDH